MLCKARTLGTCKCRMADPFYREHGRPMHTHSSGFLCTRKVIRPRSVDWTSSIEPLVGTYHRSHLTVERLGVCVWCTVCLGHVVLWGIPWGYVHKLRRGFMCQLILLLSYTVSRAERQIEKTPDWPNS